MPLYEYECLDCGVKFEVLRSFEQADEPVLCVQCGGAQTRRSISVFTAVSTGPGSSPMPIAGAGCAGCGGGSCAYCRQH